MVDYGDIPVNQALQQMEELIKNEVDVYIKYSCFHCKSRQTSNEKNTYYQEGYECSECGKMNNPQNIGYLVVASTIKGKDFIRKTMISKVGN